MDKNKLMILGKQCNSIEDLRLAQYNLIWLTYRSGFQDKLNKKICTDAGWGCMLRSGQMMFANCIQHHLIKNPNLIQNQRLNNNKDINLFIIGIFIEQQDIIFSIQSIAEVAFEEFKLKMGFWYSPNRISYCLMRLLNESSIPQNIQLSSQVMYSDRPLNFSACVTAMTGEKIDLSLASDILVDVNKDQKMKQSLLLIIICQIGIESPEEQYLNILINLFNHQFSIGMIGGKQNSGYYFIGMENDKLLFLDPHTVQKAANQQSDIDLSTYKQQEIKSIHKTALGPSVGLGFYIPDLKALNEFWSYLLELQKEFPDDFFLMIQKEYDNQHKDSELHEDQDFFIID